MFDVNWLGERTAATEAVIFACCMLALVFMVMGAALVRMMHRAQGLELQLRRLRAAVDEHCLVNVTDNDGRMLYANEMFLERCGRPRHEVLGRRLRDIDPRAVSLERDAEVRRVLSQGQIWSGDTEFHRRDGTTFLTHTTIVPLRDAKGRISESIAIRTDMTARRAADAEMHLRNVLDLWLDEVWMFSPGDLRLSYMNRRALKRLGWEPKDYVGRTLADMGDLIDMAKLQREARRLLQGQAQSVAMMLDDGDRPVEFTLQLVNVPGSPPRFVAVLRDLSEQMAAAKVKSEFIAMVSHELRTPLTSIKGGLGLLGMTAATELSDRSKSILAIAQRNTDRLILLINDILDLEKIDAGKMEVNMHRADVAALVREAIETNVSYGSQFGVTFNAVGLDRAVLAEVSPERMLQVMANLMSNAAKFSKPGSTVDVGLRVRGNHVRIFVKDFGEGIPLAAQPRILDRFTQAETGDRRRAGGTGLGLSIVKSIVEQHGSQIQFISVPGEGTEFYFDLELYAPKAAIA